MKKYISLNQIQYQKCYMCKRSHPLASYERDEDGEFTGRILKHTNLLCRPCMRNSEVSE